MFSQRKAASTPSLLAWALPLFTIVVSVGGCSTAPAPAHPDYHGVDAATSEYQEEAKTLRLAPGDEWPAEPIERTFQGSPIRYETGYGRQAADQYWFCSWAHRALDPKVGATAQREAVEEMQGLETSFYFTVLNDHSKPWVRRELRLAKLGNFELVREDVNANCP